jgi:hypothetical protein
MEKIIKFLPAMAILLGSGLAVAGHVSYNDHNVKNVAPQGQPPVWEPIDQNEEVNCDSNPARFCTAYMDEFENILDPSTGDYN